MRADDLHLSATSIELDLATDRSVEISPEAADERSSISRMSQLASSVALAVHLGLRPVIGDANITPSWAWIVANNVTSENFLRKDVVKSALCDAIGCIPAHELEDGMTLALGARLTSCVRDYGERCLGKLANMAMTNEGGAEPISHALRWIGRLTDPETLQGRLRLLIRVLDASSPIVRDGAALGLVELDSATAVPALREAILKEPNESLRQDLQQAADYLDRTV